MLLKNLKEENKKTIMRVVVNKSYLVGDEFRGNACSFTRACPQVNTGQGVIYVPCVECGARNTKVFTSKEEAEEWWNNKIKELEES